MDVRLRIIGSSPAWPNPGGVHAGYLVESDQRLLLDCGPGVLSRLRRDDLLPVDAIAITHFHLDHFGDLVPWVWMAEGGYASGRSPRLYLPPNGREELGGFGARLGQRDMFDRAFLIEEYQPGVSFDIGDCELVAFAVEHFDVPAYGFQVRNGDRSLGYSGDSSPCAGLRDIAAGVDLLLCEATLERSEDDAPERGHLSAEEALEAATGQVLLTHRPTELGTPEGAKRAVDGMLYEI